MKESRNKANEPAYLFVYGTLRKAHGGNLHSVLEENAVPLGEAEFQGRLYLAGDYPGAVDSKKPRNRVKGEVYRLRDERAVLPRLDVYEEFNPEHPESALFVRRKRPVILRDGRKISAWVYLYNRPTDQLRPIPSGDFLAVAD